MSQAPATALGPVPSTLVIPLVARARGAALFPSLAVHDHQAERLLPHLGVDAQAYLDDGATVASVLARTRLLRRLAMAFFDQHPAATGASLGCGLGDYFQWLDNGRNRWIDADLPEVIALRRRWLREPRPRHRQVALDLTDAGWWQALAPTRAAAPEPALLICEGVLMYLEPAQVQQVLHRFASSAAPGSQLLLDLVCRQLVGRGQDPPSVRRTGACFRWGPQRLDDLLQAHPRLQLLSEHDVLAGLGWPYALTAPVFRWWWGVPLYGVVQLGI